MMKFDDKIFLAKQIKEHRKRLGLTQEELAEKVELSTQHISRIESGCYIPSLKSFFMIAVTLKMDLRVFGFNIEETANPLKDKLIKNISAASDAELIFYENLFESVNKSFAKVKRELL